jgi:glycosyltransferase involved in cell wall biosynthesis
MKPNKLRLTYLTQVPGPYREQMHEIIACNASFEYSVIYCTKLEPNRSWKLSYGDYKKFFLTETSKNYRHNNPGVWKLLNRLDPEILIITAFKPTMLYGVLWCMLKRRKLIVYNDGTLESERHFSKVQKLIRKIVFKRTDAFLAPGIGTFDLYKSYSVPEEKMFKSCLCVDNSRFTKKEINEREFHIMFSGQIINRKMPLFFVEVAKHLKKHIGNLKVLVVGDGDQRGEMLEELDKNNIDYLFTGFLDQDSLPSYYSKAKLFLFPTLNDPWGVVANESCASGTPVITNPLAGVANDLVLHNTNGYVLPLDAAVWAEQALQLLNDTGLLNSFSQNAYDTVQAFNHQQSAQGIYESVSYTNSTTQFREIGISQH